MAKPVQLYIKTHNVTGLKYFGKTTSADAHKYKGSGKRWVNHIKVHGYDVTTVVVGVFDDLAECLAVAKAFSRDNDIALSDQWANLKDETLDGGFDHIHAMPKEVKRAWVLAWRASLTSEELAQHDARKAQHGKANFWFGKNRSGDKNPMHGTQHRQSSIELISESKKGKFIVKDVDGSIIGLVDIDHPNVLSGLWVSVNSGRKATDETKRILSDAKKRLGLKPPSPKGMLWWNNGVTVARSKACPGDDYVRGRTLKAL